MASRLYTLLKSMITKINQSPLNAYPVGSIYISTVATSPKTLLGGGTWTQLNAGYMLKTVTSGAGSYGGSGTSGSTTLTVDQIPAHTHTYYSPIVQLVTPTTTETKTYGNYNKQYLTKSSSTGGGEGHTHTVNPPYFTVYMWRRTA